MGGDQFGAVDLAGRATAAEYGAQRLAGAFGLFKLALARGYSLAGARTIAAYVFVMVETGYLFNCRSLVRPLWVVAPFSNPWVWVGSGTMLVLPRLFTYLHGSNRVFGTAPIGVIDGIAIPGVAMVCAIVVEWSKRASPAGAAQ